MQFGIGPLGSAQLPARGDPLARQGGFPAQPAPRRLPRDRHLAR